jgi:hypothetical protein
MILFDHYILVDLADKLVGVLVPQSGLTRLGKNPLDLAGESGLTEESILLDRQCTIVRVRTVTNDSSCILVWYKEEKEDGDTAD